MLVSATRRALSRLARSAPGDPALPRAPSGPWGRGWASLAGLDLDDDDSLAPKQKDQQYVDRLKITARAGDGGNGCVSFWRSAAKGKHVPADGGNGAPGGSVVLRASSNMKSLAGVQQLYSAERGGHGSKQKQNGRAGRDTVVLVPVGTVVSRLLDPGDGVDAPLPAGVTATGEEADPSWLRRWQRPWVGADEYASSDSDSEGEGEGEEAAATGAAPADPGSRRGSSGGGGAGGQAAVPPPGGVAGGEEAEYEVLADLVSHGQEVVAARGGAGGRGNAAARALPRRPAPATAERGSPGAAPRLLLELKLLAEMALVGLPNVGKSSLLRAMSAATPRVAGYAFTTLTPQLGAVDLGGGERLVVADVPGLVEGAHANRGLGHRFLRHVERTRALAFVVDAAGGSPLGATPLGPWQQLALLRDEVGRFSPALLRRPWMVVANKTDLLPRPAAALARLQQRCEGAGWGARVVGASATGRGEGGAPQGVPQLLAEMRVLLAAAAAAGGAEAP